MQLSFDFLIPKIKGLMKQTIQADLKYFLSVGMNELNKNNVNDIFL